MADPTSIRIDPYESFKFRVKWDGRYVAGITKVSSLTRTTEVVELHEGSDPSITYKVPGRTKFEPITLERGITQDKSFENWANAVLAGSSSLAGLRKDVWLEIQNEAGQVVLAYKIYRCWVSEYKALPDLDASGNCSAIEHIKLENEGWERDTYVVGPSTLA
jgi:phage tail-like protein